MADPVPDLPYHCWPRAYGGWQDGSFIRCNDADCQLCKAHWPLVDPHTPEDIEGQAS